MGKFRASGAHTTVEVREIATLASVGLITLVLCSLLGGCALTRVQASPVHTPVSSVSIGSVETTFGMPAAVKGRLSNALESSVSATGQVVSGAVDSACLMMATVKRRFTHTMVESGPHHDYTSFDVDTYEIKLRLLDGTGTVVGTATVEVDEDSGVLEHDPKREEVLLAAGLKKATQALFAGTALPGQAYARR